MENEGPRIRAYIDGKLVLEASDPEFSKARPACSRPLRRASRISVSPRPDAEVAAIRARISARETELAKLRAANPKPKLWKKFETPNFGAGRNVRFGDLDGDGVPTC